MVAKKKSRRKKVSREDVLCPIIELIEPVEDETLLHVLVYLAQTLDGLGSLYEFSHTQSVPVSVELSIELCCLVQRKLIIHNSDWCLICAELPNSKKSRKTNIDWSPFDANRQDLMEEICQLDRPMWLTLYQISRMHQNNESAEELIGQLVKKTLIHRQYAEQAVDFCVKWNLFGL